tara:strand:+ start:295 stop:606 length:312 start_codon:yes stop_codon:yes gene_type:complete
MDIPVYRELREITRHGTQTIITPASGIVSGDFYAVSFFSATTTIESITIDNQVNPSNLTGLDIFDRNSRFEKILYNVNSILISGATAVCIAYTAPIITGQIES